MSSSRLAALAAQLTDVSWSTRVPRWAGAGLLSVSARLYDGLTGRAFEELSLLSRTFRLAELFSGPGGLALGASRATVPGATVHPVWANDVDPWACETYRHNIHPDNAEAVICRPVQELDLASDMPSFELLAFGFPCNDFSNVGERLGFDGKFGPLYTYGVRAIETHEPLAFVAENVSGLSNSNDGKAFEQILDDLVHAGPGYRVTAHLYRFEDYGVPQRRHRIIIVGVRDDLGITFRVPAPTHAGRPVSARTAIEDPPIPDWATNRELTRQTAQVVERLRHIPPGENAWYEGIPEHLRLNVKGALISQIYRRLHPDEPSYTVTGSGGGGTHVYHWAEDRALTNRERARLQTFPDDYVFLGPKEAVRKQIGMAVPPLGAEVVFTALLSSLQGIDYESVNASLHEHDVKERCA